ncbi:Serine/threonine-protein kinase AtPK2/AtPK19-like protein [Drosera capensis]
MASTQRRKALLSAMAAKLTLNIPTQNDPSSSSSPSQSLEFDFSDAFGPNPSPSPLLPDIPHGLGDTQLSDDYDNGVCDDNHGDDGEEGEKGKMGPEDFEILRLVGKGAFGKVFLVRKKERGFGEGDGVYAMKVMKKHSIIKKNHVEYMKRERDILTKVVHPFIVQLRYSFQTKSKLYVILDFVNWGHLFFHLYGQGLFSEDQARRYTAEIVSTLSHLHKSGIVHRDLKPENILMDADGHVVLTDFGLAKEIDESSRSNSMCGTMEYMAPEIIQSKGHNKDADWWSVGILLDEMLSGQPPFTHANWQKLQQKIISEKVKLFIPHHRSTFPAQRTTPKGSMKAARQQPYWRR